MAQDKLTQANQQQPREQEVARAQEWISEEILTNSTAEFARMAVDNFADFCDLLASYAAAYHAAQSTDQKALIAELVEGLNALRVIAEASPELNMCNYNEDDVSALNQAMIQIVLKLRAVLARTKESL